MKSYGRAPTFLLRTGCEQVRCVDDATPTACCGAGSPHDEVAATA